MARHDFSDALPVAPDRLNTYLIDQGFRAAGAGSWHRGSTLGAWMGFTPKSWPATVSIESDQLTLSVRAGGQILTRSESAFWQQEWDNMCAAAAGHLTDTTALAHRRDVSFVENAVTLALPMPVAITAGVAVGLLLHPLAGLALFVVSVVVMYGFGIWWLVGRR